MLYEISECISHIYEIQFKQAKSLVWCIFALLYYDIAVKTINKGDHIFEHCNWCIIMDIENALTRVKKSLCALRVLSYEGCVKTAVYKLYHIAYACTVSLKEWKIICY